MKFAKKRLSLFLAFVMMLTCVSMASPIKVRAAASSAPLSDFTGLGSCVQYYTEANRWWRTAVLVLSDGNGHYYEGNTVRVANESDAANIKVCMIILRGQYTMNNYKNFSVTSREYSNTILQCGENRTVTVNASDFHDASTYHCVSGSKDFTYSIIVKPPKTDASSITLGQPVEYDGTTYVFDVVYNNNSYTSLILDEDVLVEDVNDIKLRVSVNNGEFEEIATGTVDPATKTASVLFNPASVSGFSESFSGTKTFDLSFKHILDISNVNYGEVFEGTVDHKQYRFMAYANYYILDGTPAWIVSEEAVNADGQFAIDVDYYDGQEIRFELQCRDDENSEWSCVSSDAVPYEIFMDDPSEVYSSANMEIPSQFKGEFVYRPVINDRRIDLSQMIPHNRYSTYDNSESFFLLWMTGYENNGEYIYVPNQEEDSTEYSIDLKAIYEHANPENGVSICMGLFRVAPETQPGFVQVATSSCVSFICETPSTHFDMSSNTFEEYAKYFKGEKEFNVTVNDSRVELSDFVNDGQKIRIGDADYSFESTDDFRYDPDFGKYVIDGDDDRTIHMKMYKWVDGTKEQVGNEAVINYTSIGGITYSNSSNEFFSVEVEDYEPYSGRVKWIRINPDNTLKKYLKNFFWDVISITKEETDISNISSEKGHMITMSNGERLFLHAGIDMTDEESRWYVDHTRNCETEFATPSAMRVENTEERTDHSVVWKIYKVGEDDLVDDSVSFDWLLFDDDVISGSNINSSGYYLHTTDRSGYAVITPSVKGFLEGLRGLHEIRWTVGGENDDQNNYVPDQPKKPDATNEVKKVETEVKDDITVLKKIEIDDETKKTEEKNLVIKTDDKSGKKGIEITKEQAEQVLDVLKDTDNNKEELTLKFDKYEVTFDQKALETVKNEAKGDSLRIVAEDKNEGFTDEQKKVISEVDPVFSFEAYVESNGKRIHDFKGGEANVVINVGKLAGLDKEHLFVEYVSEKGDRERMDTRITDDGNIEFRTGHLSDYLVVYDENEVNGYDDEFTAVFKMSKAMRVGAKFNFILNTKGKTAIFTSSDSNVVTVNSKGVIKAKKAGKAVISVESGDYRAEITVVVVANKGPQRTTAKADAVKASNNGAALTVMKKLAYGKNFKMAFDNAEGAKITYNTSNDNVKVSKKGVMKRVKSGKCYVDITVEQNGIMHKYRVVAD